MAEKPEGPSRVGGRAAEDRGDPHQAAAATEENTGTRMVTGTMEEVLKETNLWMAVKRVRENKGAPGVDGMTIDDLRAFLASDRWRQIAEELLEGRYRPQAVLGVEIPKPRGGKRLLGIPTVADRMIQQAILQVIQPGIDETFSESSYGYRPNRSAHEAVQRMKENVEAGYEWIVDCDLAKFFDEVQHDVLMARVARRIQDKRILRTIRRFLQAGLMRGGLTSQRFKGTPQGGPMSPLLSNILLDELDRELERRGHRFIRYADDFIVFVRSQRAGERVLESLEQFLGRKLRLRVNRDKSKVVRAHECTYLGYSMAFHKDGTVRLVLPRETIKRFKRKVTEIAGRWGRGQSMDAVVNKLNPLLRGWYNYYSLSDFAGVYKGLDSYVRRRLRWLYWRHWKTPRTRKKRLVNLGLSPERASTAAYANCGPWRCSGLPAVQQALRNDHFHEIGLMCIDREHDLRLAMAALGLRSTA